MKRIALLFSIWLCSFLLLGESFSGIYYPNPDVSYFFQNGILKIDEFISKGKHDVEFFEYKYEETNKIPFITIENEEGSKRYLILYSDEFLLMYDSPMSEPIQGGFFGRYIYDLFLSPVNYSVTNYLIDSKYDFSGENLGNLALFKPWVEGESDVGIGQQISLRFENGNDIHGFYFSNGFVSYNKPFLYEMNSRVKKIAVFDESNTFYREYEIVDSPKIQFFDVPIVDNITIKILDVYHGSEWTDTCINFILLESR